MPKGWIVQTNNDIAGILANVGSVTSQNEEQVSTAVAKVVSRNYDPQRARALSVIDAAGFSGDSPGSGGRAIINALMDTSWTSAELRQAVAASKVRHPVNKTKRKNYLVNWAQQRRTSPMGSVYNELGLNLMKLGEGRSAQEGWEVFNRSSLTVGGLIAALGGPIGAIIGAVIGIVGGIVELILAATRKNIKEFEAETAALAKGLKGDAATQEKTLQGYVPQTKLQQAAAGAVKKDTTPPPTDEPGGGGGALLLVALLALFARKKKKRKRNAYAR